MLFSKADSMELHLIRLALEKLANIESLDHSIRPTFIVFDPDESAESEALALRKKQLEPYEQELEASNSEMVFGEDRYIYDDDNPNIAT